MGSLDGEGLVGEGGYDVFETPGAAVRLMHIDAPALRQANSSICHKCHMHM